MVGRNLDNRLGGAWRRDRGLPPCGSVALGHPDRGPVRPARQHGGRSGSPCLGWGGAIGGVLLRSDPAWGLHEADRRISPTAHLPQQLWDRIATAPSKAPGDDPAFARPDACKVLTGRSGIRALAARPRSCQNPQAMATVDRPSFGTHEVANQPPPLVDYNVFTADQVLGEAVRREGADWAEERISAVGAVAGSEHVQALGAQANENPPRLKTHDRYGRRVDTVDFHPAWHEL